MKKMILFFTCIMLALTGCSMNNTPTKKVENFLDNYRHQDSKVMEQLKEMVDSDNLMNADQKNEYTDVMKRQYRDLTYEIKDETIDGDNATVTAEVEVYDYYKVNKEAEEYYNSNPDEFKERNKTATGDQVGDSRNSTPDTTVDKPVNKLEELGSDAKYIAYRITKLGQTTDRIKYTIDFTLRKENNEWLLNDIDDATRKKIHGLYEH